jgi:phosphatidylethanolamine/phosphatidyl-N-methylethanolamine N-methyltransferase
MNRIPDISKLVRRRFGDEIVFWRSWLDSPRGVGAVLPTSPKMAKHMAEVVDPNSSLPVLELGPGTGIISRAILKRGVPAEKLFMVEFSPQFVRLLKLRFESANVLHGDAFDLDTALGEHRDLRFDSVVCSLPLMNFAPRRRHALILDLLDRMAPGRPIVLFTYAMLPPVRPKYPGEFVLQHHHFVMRNVPPANLWVYRRPPALADNAAA